MLNVIILSVVMLNVVAPIIDLFCSQPYRPLTEERGRLQEEVPAVGGHLRHVFAGRKRTSGEPRRRAGTTNFIKLLGHHLGFTFFRRITFCRQAFDCRVMTIIWSTVNKRFTILNYASVWSVSYDRNLRS